jgi:hypothetical protein
MSRLSACYFCGAALEESLSEVSLEPGVSDPTTVTLCPGCQEKLETVLAVTSQDSPVERDQPQGHEPGTASATDAGEEARDPEVGPQDPVGDGGDSQIADPSGSGNGGSGADDGDRSIVEGDQEISALEYNKVMRLLQNRAFPVDRQEIVTVAANAYEVSRRDCDRVIDAAIERGLLAEDEAGQLVRAE